MSAVIRFAFETLELNRVQAFVMTDNVASVKLLQKLGFHQEGTLREYLVLDGACFDAHCFSLLKRNYTAETWH